MTPTPQEIVRALRWQSVHVSAVFTDAIDLIEALSSENARLKNMLKEHETYPAAGVINDELGSTG